MATEITLLISFAITSLFLSFMIVVLVVFKKNTNSFFLDLVRHVVLLLNFLVLLSTISVFYLFKKNEDLGNLIINLLCFAIVAITSGIVEGACIKPKTSN